MTSGTIQPLPTPPHPCVTDSPLFCVIVRQNLIVPSGSTSLYISDKSLKTKPPSMISSKKQNSLTPSTTQAVFKFPPLFHKHLNAYSEMHLLEIKKQIRFPLVIG